MGLLREFSGKAAVFEQPVGSLGRALYEKPVRDPREVLAEVDLADAAKVYRPIPVVVLAVAAHAAAAVAIFMLFARRLG